MSAPNLEEWNRQHVALMQALLGTISANFRMVWLEHQDEEWVVHFVLERPNEIDLEEIDDAMTDFEALQDGPISCRADVIADTDELQWPAFPSRIIFRRRED